MSDFGALLRTHRHRTSDPLRGTYLSQERLGEEIGDVLGDAGYSAVAVSNWERNRNRINADERQVLAAIIKVLYDFGGLASVDEANALLRAGNYRSLDGDESRPIFGFASPPITPVPATPVSTPPPAAAVGGGAPPADSLERKRELILLNKVQQFWIRDVLEESIAGFVDLEVTGSIRPDALLDVWEDVVYTPSRGGSVTLDEAALVAAFVDSGRSLLILGRPGAGKTFTLLRLARALLTQAAADPAVAIPVVLNLSSWAEDEVLLGEWVLDELAEKYQIPRKFGRVWLENDRLTLLLDGFDVLPEPARDNCVAGINQFRHDYGFTGIIVCSRTSTYFETDSRLLLGTAIELDLLPPETVDGHLAAAGLDSAAIRRELEDAGTAAFLQSPLVLRVLTSLRATEDTPFTAHSRRQMVDEDAYLNALIAAYVEQMLATGSPDHDFNPTQTRRWLGWLAARMADHNQTELFIDHIQPSWLPSAAWRHVYVITTRLVDGTIIGIILWLLLQQLRFIHPDLPLGATRPFFGSFNLPVDWREFAWLICGNILLGFLVALLQIFFYERKPLQRFTSLSLHQQHVGQIIIAGTLVALITFGLFAWIGNLVLVLFWSLVQAIVHMLFARFVHGANYRTEFRRMNALSWSWRRTAIGLAGGLAMAIFAELIEGSYGISNGIWPTLLAYGATGVLLGGLSGQRIKRSARPNQGIRQAAANAVRATMISLPVMGVMSLLLWGAGSLLITTALVLLAAFAFFGGSRVFNHVLLRAIFMYVDLMPGDVIQLLNQATAQSLMRKVGGGYIFAHQLIQEYLARQMPQPEGG